jgi:1-deoxy-D-xylulose-5-phosphate reductoisomerase
MVVLGSTGSIGVNTLEIASRYSLGIEVLVAGNSIELLNRQIAKHNPKIVVVKDESNISKINHSRVYSGESGILKAIEESKSQVVVNALVGFAGLKPTLKAIESNKKVALANKESLVVAGSFIDMSYITPIDSEHFGLQYLLDKNKKIHSMMITASGGAFRDRDITTLKDVTLEEVLKHPNWKMGQKITIDSATMVNKLFEVLEAKWLFDTVNIDAFIETKSLLHALVNYSDGSTTAHFAKANMQLPIAYALLDRVDENIVEHIDFKTLSNLDFKEIKDTQYPIWQIKDELLQNPQNGVVVNALNEVAIGKFLKKEIGFLDISKTILDGYSKFSESKYSSIDDIFEKDRVIREFYQK